MVFINHRINTLAQLREVPIQNGIELDIRYHQNDLILHHDPFGHHIAPLPEKFETLLQNWHHQGPMILNIKTEGIEQKCIDLMARYAIKKWFFLDLSMPYFVRYATHAASLDIPGFTPDNLAVRFSEYEPIEYAVSFSHKVRWVWVDCFTRLPLDEQVIQKLQKAGFKLCLVSPELQGHSLDKISDFKQQLQTFPIEAVCTKRPDLWL